MQKFQTNFDIHNISPRYRHNLHVATINLSKCQKGIFDAGINSFSNILPTPNGLNHNIKLFRLVLSHSSSMEEFTSTKNYQLLIDVTNNLSYMSLNLYIAV